MQCDQLLIQAEILLPGSAYGDEPALPIPMQIVQGRLDSVHILFDSIAIVAGFDSIYQFSKDDEIAIPLPDTVVPGYYPAMLRLGTPRCPAPDVPVMVQVNYPSSIVAQKNGIIALAMLTVFVTSLTISFRLFSL